MSQRYLEVNRRGNVLDVCISNPPTHTLTAGGVAELSQLLDEVEDDPGIRVLVFTGGGEGVFIAHYEVNELADSADRSPEQMGESDDHPEQLHAMHRVCLRLEALPVITVAAVNGNAAGGGCELSLACDFRLMADGPFVFGLPETSVGIIPGAGGTQRYARLLGTARALDLILHARLLNPLEALELGLLHRLFPVESFNDEVRDFADDLVSRAPIALAAAKEAIRRGAEELLEDGLQIEQSCFNRTMRSRDAAGAMRAWLEGKTYEWKGE